MTMKLSFFERFAIAYIVAVPLAVWMYDNPAWHRPVILAGSIMMGAAMPMTLIGLAWRQVTKKTGPSWKLQSFHFLVMVAVALAVANAVARAVIPDFPLL